MTSRLRRPSPLLLGLALGLTPAMAVAVEVELKPGDDVATLTAAMQAGDVYTFSGGTYELESGITWRGVGTEQDPIIIRAASGETPVIQVSGGSSIITIDAAAYISIQGMTFSGDDQWDVEDSGANYYGLIVRNSPHITIEDCEIRQTARQAIVATGSEEYSPIEGLTIRRTHIHDVLRDDGIYAGCGNGTCALANSLIERNWIHDLLGTSSDGIEIGPNSYGFEIVDNVVYNTQDGGITTSTTNFEADNIIERNVVWSVANDALNISGGAVVRNNIAFNSTGFGIRSEPSDTSSSGSIVIAHNTVVNTQSAGVYIRNWSGAEGMVLANNAITNVTGIAMDVSVDELNHLAGNVVTGLVTGADAGFAGGGGLDDYVDAEEWNYWPSADSHLVSAADTSATSWVPSLDFNGNARPGDAPDSGALERDGASNPGWQIREGFKEDPVDDGGDGTAGVEGGCGCGDSDGDGATPTVALLLGLGLIWRRPRRS